MPVYALKKKHTTIQYTYQYFGIWIFKYLHVGINFMQRLRQDPIFKDSDSGTGFVSKDSIQMFILDERATSSS